MPKKLLFFIAFIGIFLFHFNGIAQDESNNTKAGQKVEEVVIEQPDIEVDEEVFEKLEVNETLTRDALASDVVGDRPDEEGVPTFVKVGLYVDDIAMLDDAEQTFTATMRVTLRWVDPRLKMNTDKIRQFPIDSIWNPLIKLVNKRSVTKEVSDNVFVDPVGHVLYAQRYQGTFTVPLNLQDFPLDIHKLNILIRSFYPPEEVQLVIDEGLTGWANTLSIPDWLVEKGEAKINTFFSNDQRKDLSQFEFSFEIHRRIGFYLWKIIIPLSLIVMMSWGVFWIYPERLEAQIGLSATAFLTLFAFQFAISNHLPKIAYLTRMDRFTMLCSLLVFLALLEGVLASSLVKSGKLEKALTIDRYARFIFPLSFIVIWAYSFWL